MFRHEKPLNLFLPALLSNQLSLSQNVGLIDSCFSIVLPYYSGASSGLLNEIYCSSCSSIQTTFQHPVILFRFCVPNCAHCDIEKKREGEESKDKTMKQEKKKKRRIYTQQEEEKKEEKKKGRSKNIFWYESQKKQRC